MTCFSWRCAASVSVTLLGPKSTLNAPAIFKPRSDVLPVMSRSSRRSNAKRKTFLEDSRVGLPSGSGRSRVHPLGADMLKMAADRLDIGSGQTELGGDHALFRPAS